MSLNNRYPELPCDTQVVPSVKPKSPRTSSSLASGDTSASSAGSRRTTDVSDDCAAAEVAVIAVASRAIGRSDFLIAPSPTSLRATRLRSLRELRRVFESAGARRRKRSNLSRGKHERLAEIAFGMLRMPRNDDFYFPACTLSAARSASLRKLITATLLVRE